MSEPASADAPNVVWATIGYDFSRMSCLLAEANKFMRGVLRIVMEFFGVRNHHFAANGKEAIEIL
ncbi:MAG: hypothetical protein VX639_10655 [Pseudomonadota bacterium]|nr:hypothetical protein [Pseudomonadota bacterium]